MNAVGELRARWVCGIRHRGHPGERKLGRQPGDDDHVVGAILADVVDQRLYPYLLADGAVLRGHETAVLPQLPVGE